MGIKLEKDSYSKDEVAAILTEQEKAVQEQVKTVVTEELTKEAQKKIQEEVQKAVKTEKDTLYQTIEHHKAKADEAQKALADAKAQLEAATKTEGTGSKEAMEAQAKIAALETSLTELKDTTKRLLEEQSANFNSVLQKKDLEVKKEKLIADAKGEIIPDLVSGETEEELIASVERAKTRYKEVVAEIKNRNEQQQLANSQVPGASGHSGNGQISGGTPNVFAMSKEEFDEYAKKELEKIK